MAKPGAADLENLVRNALPFQPNSDQVNAIAKISRFILEEGDDSLFILKGYAGTGKTNLISAFTRVLPNVKWRSVLLAPTGRAAKVISSYSQRDAFTIHKKIFKKYFSETGGVVFGLAENLHRNTLFIVDEASMISADQPDEGGYFSSLLSNLFEYVYSGVNCKLILVGDTAQLPPVGSENSPALDRDYLGNNFSLRIHEAELKEVARQESDSGILLNATCLRILLQQENPGLPQLDCGNDLINVSGEDLEDTLQSSISQHGDDNVMIITRSNKRANLFNQNFRNRIRLYEEDLCAGDKLMIVKNNYFWQQDKSDNGFIANGEMVEITKIIRREKMYGFDFADIQIRFCDDEKKSEQEVKIITNSLYTDHPALSQEDLKTLANNILEDVADESNKSIKFNYLRKSPFYNALQVKFSYAVTCHKSQGGQWPVIFLDQGYITEETADRNFIRWLYTAITRASEKVYLVNFNSLFIK